jgi:uncharacterized membrane protein YecN with MAPEG domain
MTFEITGLYAAILGVFFIFFRTLVVIERAKTGISMMHGDNIVLARKIRVFGNFIEIVPHALILMAIAEVMGAGALILHSIGGLLVLSRILLPLGLNPENGKTLPRIAAGMTASISMIISIGYIFLQYFN